MVYILQSLNLKTGGPLSQFAFPLPSHIIPTCDMHHDSVEPLPFPFLPSASSFGRESRAWPVFASRAPNGPPPRESPLARDGDGCDAATGFSVSKSHLSLKETAWKPRKKAGVPFSPSRNRNLKAIITYVSFATCATFDFWRRYT